jgi:ABC-type sugar transport system substrate-binding protein
MRRSTLITLLAALMVMAMALGASAALAGEVKGPSGDPTVQNTNYTGALDHAKSACAASGLNDWDRSDPSDQNESKVQTAADSWKYYELPKGSPGTLFGGPGLCRGGGPATS